MLQEPTITFTVKAADKAAELRKEEGNPSLMLRVAIQGGGCSGFIYTFTFDDTKHADDVEITQTCSNGEKMMLIIDGLSYPYLTNAEIDFVSSLKGEQFVIKNPGATTTCGCGRSFSVGDE